MSRTVRTYYVYIMASLSRTLYVGVTGDIERRVSEHLAGDNPGFTQRYHITRLVHLEQFGEIEDAIAREKQLKGWSRAKKVKLIQLTNPCWNDLSLI